MEYTQRMYIAIERQKIGTIRSLLIGATAALFLAVLPIWPYGFYTLLRLLVCGVCFYLVYKIKFLPTFLPHKVPLIIIAVLFNPLIPVYLVRTIWFPVDIGIGIYLIILIKKLGTLISEKENS